MDSIDTVVIGSGQAGLAVSYLLNEAGVDHIVFERGRIGESWRSQRWDSFALNTPNWANRLPGEVRGQWDDDGFGLVSDLVEYFERYAASYSAPIRENTPVSAVEQSPDGSFTVETSEGRVQADNVIVCSGTMSTPHLPPVAAQMADRIETLTAGTYKNAGDLRPGAVIVVGSGQSGCQVVEDLLGAGRTVYLCASKVGRVVRRYRGRDIIDWMSDTGFMDVVVDQLEDPDMQYATQPQVSGADGGHTVSLQSLARDGATLLGRIDAIEGSILRLRPNLNECVEFADQVSATFKSTIDDFIADNRIEAPPAETDPYEPPMPDLGGSDALEELDLDEAGVSTIIWCTGFRGDFSWLGPDLLDDRGTPRHQRGVSEVPGLYFAGFPWLSKRKSGILLGVSEDAAHVVKHLTSRS